MTTLVICTKGSKSLSVLRQSIAAYCPELSVQIFQTTFPSFGESYNFALSTAFMSNDEVLFANDDIVLTPSTISLLLEDVEILKSNIEYLGLVAPRSDNIRGLQSLSLPDSKLLKETHTLSPVLAWMSREAFQRAQFAPINWFSDDVMCEDLSALGYRHFLSRSYVHHVGSTTIGEDNNRHVNEALPWLLSNRPHYVKKWWPNWGHA